MNLSGLKMSVRMYVVVRYLKSTPILATKYIIFLWDLSQSGVKGANNNVSMNILTEEQLKSVYE